MFPGEEKLETYHGIHEIHNEHLIWLKMDQAPLAKASAIGRKTSGGKPCHADKENKAPGKAGQHSRAETRHVSCEHKNAEDEFHPRNDSCDPGNHHVRNDIIRRDPGLEILHRIHELGVSGISENKSDQEPPQKENLVRSFAGHLSAPAPSFRGLRGLFGLRCGQPGCPARL